MQATPLQVGKTHATLGAALNKGFARLRGRLFSIVEVAAFSAEQEEAMKALIREETSTFWTSFAQLLAAELKDLAEQHQVKSVDSSPTQITTQNYGT